MGPNIVNFAPVAPFKKNERSARIVVILVPRLLMTVGIAMMVLPIAMATYMSFFSDSILVFPPTGYTVSWYTRLGEFPNFVLSLMTSVRVAAFATLGSLTLGIPASVALVRYKFPGRALLSVVLLSPLTVPGIVLGLAIYVLLIKTESVTGTALIGSDLVLVLAHMLITIPWVIRLCVANLLDVDRRIEEAAANLGARPNTVFWLVTLPLVRQGIVAAALFSFIVSFENIELTLFLISPGNTTLPISVLQYLEYKVDPLVAAVAVIQTIVIGGTLFLIDRYVKLSRVI